jgi:hypothetical protein
MGMSRIDEIKERSRLINMNMAAPGTEDYRADVSDLLSKLEAVGKALEELQRYTAPDYPFKSAETIAEFHTLIGIALKQLKE